MLGILFEIFLYASTATLWAIIIYSIIKTIKASRGLNEKVKTSETINAVKRNIHTNEVVRIK